MEQNPYTRIFIVAGKSVEAEMLTDAFRPFGTILSVKVVKDKGVAYVNYDRPSAAAAAIEAMNEKVLNNGRGPSLKVMLAEALKSNMGRRTQLAQTATGGDQRDRRAPQDPDNIPVNSRLFIVVPKTADGSAIEAEMRRYEDLQWCKTDLIATKGIVFCKYSKSSSAFKAMEGIQEAGSLASYTVKIMLAEPKGKRSRNEVSGYTDPVSPVLQAPSLVAAAFSNPSFPGSSLSTGSFLNPNPTYPQSPSHSGISEARAPSLNSAWNPPFASNLSRRTAEINARFAPGGSLGPGLGLQAPPLELPNSLGMDGPGHLAGLQALAAIQGAANLSNSLNNPELAGIGNQVGFSNLEHLNISHNPLGGLKIQTTMGQLPFDAANQSAPNTPMGPLRLRDGALEPNSETSLHVILPKNVTQEVLYQMFCTIPGLETCELILDPATGASKGVAVVSYNCADAAAVAVTSFNGSQHMKVMYADSSHDGLRGGLLHTSSAFSDSNDLLPKQRDDNGEAQEPNQRLHSQDSVSDSLDHKVEVALVQNDLAHLSMPRRPEESRGPRPVANGQRLPPSRQQTLHSSLYSSGSDDKEGEADAISQAKNSTEVQSRTVYTILARPLPPYALHHYFSQQLNANVESVRLQPENGRYGVVLFAKAESARAALERLNGSDILGESLNVLPADPYTAACNKRPRFGA